VSETRTNDNFITLGQFLKKENFIASGGEAKAFLKEKEVKVNGAYENRRGRKLYKGDEVSVNGEKRIVNFDRN
jgi:ribosome-associated protein